MAAKSTNISYPQFNRILEELNKYRRPRDTRGLISAKDMFKAIRATFMVKGLLPQDVIEGVVNVLVYHGYIRIKKFTDGYTQFFLDFADVVRDEYGVVIGVRWTSKRWWEEA